MYVAGWVGGVWVKAVADSTMPRSMLALIWLAMYCGSFLSFFIGCVGVYVGVCGCMWVGG